MNEKVDQIRRTLKPWFAPAAVRRQGIVRFRALARRLVTTRPDEIDCGECFERLDRFAELIEAGSSPSRAMPLVQDHLDRCPDCKQEFLALMKAIQTDPIQRRRDALIYREIS
jgi:hypothetical protein